MGKDSTLDSKTSNKVDYYAILPDKAPGSARKAGGKKLPKLFQPLKVKNLTLPNRIGLSPMCTYSANFNLEATPFHFAHYGSFFTRGPGLAFVESTAVNKKGALSPHDLGIWTDEQARKLKEIVDFAHVHRQLVALQLGHGGRKASGQPLFIHLEEIADKSIGGWPEEVVGPSAVQYRPNGNYLTPHELSKEEIKQIIEDFGSAARRAVEIAGFDIVEIHGAHGYLICEFLSAVSNKRKDEYGGSFENRIRFLLEIIDEVRANIPKEVPLLLRISASENTDDDPDAWRIDDSEKLAKIVVERSVDIIDISSGGNNYKQSARGAPKAFHKDLAKAVKKAVGNSALVACVGGLNSGRLTNELMEEGYFDLGLVGRAYLNNPGLHLDWAKELDVDMNRIPQYDWPVHPKKEGILELIKRQDTKL